jgi:putative ABC transport system permease protein
MATGLPATARARITTFVDSVLAELALPIHLTREARADFIAHLEADVANAIGRGLPEAHAVDAAIRAFGGATDVRRALRDAAAVNRPSGMDRVRIAREALLRHLRDAGRRLWSQRAASTAAILMLATGIGVTAAAYAVFDWVLLRPLPYPASSELVRVFTAGTRPATAPADVTYSEFQQFARLGGFRRAFAYSAAVRVASAAGVDAAHVVVARVAGDPFATLAIPASEGRGFTADEIASGSPSVVVSERLWGRLGAMSSVGRQVVTIDAVPYTVIGVMPRGRGYPHDADLWRPLTADEREDDDRELVMIARLTSASAVAATGAELATQAANTSDHARTAWVESVQHADVRQVRGALQALLALACLILLMACTNAAALMAQRSAERRKELATRAALGATRSQLVHQLLTEHVLLAAIAVVAGMVMGQWVLAALMAVAPAGLPRLDDVRIDGRILGVGVGVCAVIALVLAVWPSLRSSRVRLREVIDGAGSVRVTSPHRGAHAMVSLQAALAVVLVILAGALGRTLQRLVAVDHGFTPDGMLAVSLYMRGGIGGDPRELFPRLIEAAGGAPGVVSAAVALQPPTELRGLRAQVGVAGVASEPQPVVLRPVTPLYFATIDLPMREGREFTRDDRRGAPRVAVVNESFVRDVLRGAPALGTRVVADLVDDPLTIVGIAADATPGGELDRPALYVALDQLSVAGGALLVRTARAPSTVVDGLRTALHAVEPSLPLDRISAVSDSLAAGRAVTRFLTQLASAFGAFALFLAALGVYGVTAAELAARWRELAVRQALGASLGRVLWHAIRPGMVSLAAGVAVGGLAALGASHWLAAILNGVDAADAVALTVVPVLLVSVGLTAAVTAARRVVSSNPAATLRGD